MLKDVKSDFRLQIPQFVIWSLFCFCFDYKLFCCSAKPKITNCSEKALKIELAHYNRYLRKNIVNIVFWLDTVIQVCQMEKANGV